MLAKVVGREAQHHQAAPLVTGVQGFKPLVLVGEAAVAGGVHHQQHFSGVLTQLLRCLILQPFELLLQQRRAGCVASRAGRGGQCRCPGQGARKKNQAGCQLDDIHALRLCISLSAGLLPALPSPFPVENCSSRNIDERCASLAAAGV